MCLSPIRIRTKSKYINAHSLHKVFDEVPCGKCAECLCAKRNEYYFRSYYQGVEVFERGINKPYILFDTLTYNDENVPHINDFLRDIDFKFVPEMNFTCFNPEDVRLFFVRLRRSLTYHGFDVKNKLKYFLCSEYGSDPRYTHRPHYHIMFYVFDGSLDPLVLSDYVDKCWQKGRTDGVNYQGSEYVLGKRVFRDNDDLHMQNVSNYIGKYMTKDSDFLKVVGERFETLKDWFVLQRQIYDSGFYIDYKQDYLDFLDDYNFTMDKYRDIDELAYVMEDDVDTLFALSEIKRVTDKYKLYSDICEKDITQIINTTKSLPILSEYIRVLKRHICQFIRSSQGFGYYVVDKLGKDWIFENNSLRMPDKVNIWKYIPIPEYIKCKLFREKKTDMNGEVYYGWSDYGNEFRQKHIDKRIKSMVNNCLETINYSNLANNHFSESEIDYVIREFSHLLSNRELYDVFYYQTYLKDRLYIPENELNEINHIDVESYYFIDQRSCIESDSLSNEEFFDMTNDDIIYKLDEYLYRDFAFDSILCLYATVCKKIGQCVQSSFDFEEEYRSRLKSLGYKIKN